MPTHPREVLVAGEAPFPVLSACEHFAGSAKLIVRALEIQQRMHGQIDVTADCEDGAMAGNEQAHMAMVVEQLNGTHNCYGRLGVRIHGHHHPQWRHDVDRLLSGAGERVAYVTIPKSNGVAEAVEVIAYIRKCCVRLGIERVIPIHVLIESQGALRDVWQIAGLPGVEALDFGLMDFVSAHRGAIGSAAMRSPGQFEHRLVARAKTEIVAAALANGVVPAHNVTLDLNNPDQTREDARRAREDFGFLRMWSIHPVQIDVILDAMRPDFSGLQTACAVLLEAQDADWGPIQFQGQLHDRASYRDLWHLLQQAQAFSVPLSDEVKQRLL